MGRFRYNAFMSYSHTSDDKLVRALHRSMERLGTPWYRRAAVRVFRDETALGAAPGLWSEIQRNLEQCEYFVLMSSLRAATSPWVRKEIQWWLEHRAIDHILIVLT